MDNIYSFSELYAKLCTYGDKIALVDGGEEHSYKSFCDDIKKVWSKLDTFSGEYVYIGCDNKYCFSAAVFATVLSGNIAVLGSPLVTPPAYCSHTLDSACISAYLNEPECGDVTAKQNEGIAIVLFSSGTTSTPKAVALTQRNVIMDMCSGVRQYRFSYDDRLLNILPLTHAFGLVCDLLASLYVGATLYFSYEAIDFLVKLPAVSPTMLNVPPGIVAVILQRLKTNPRQSVVGTALKKILSGGAATPEAMSVEAAKYGIFLTACYGATECSPCITVNGDDRYKLGSCGYALDCNEISITPDGIIVVKGENVFKGYLQEDGKLLENADRRFISNDLGYIDEDGFLYVSGRADDLMILSDGNKIMPQCFEEQIEQLTQGIECMVYAEGNDICALVHVEGAYDSAQLCAQIAALEYADHKIKKIQFTDTPLPRNKIGKLCRKN